jgi:hypothetical protein
LHQANDLPPNLGDDAAISIETAIQSAPDISAIAVIKSFTPESFVAASLRFAAALPSELRDQWFQAYTRTIFLAGNPQNLTHRYRFRHIADDGSSAWMDPASAKENMGLRRMLMLFQTEAPLRLPHEVCISMRGADGTDKNSNAVKRVYVATAGMTLSEYLVQLNHALAEAVLLGTIEPGDQVHIQHMPRLNGCTEHLTDIRVHKDRFEESRLQAFTGMRI